ncbi:hypothetical protein [Flavobacterium sp.]|nr:hypothetical protein [Flavobacterium sp.]
MKFNKEWHLAYRMPKNAKMQQRTDWHIEHQKIVVADQYLKKYWTK